MHIDIGGFARQVKGLIGGVTDIAGRSRPRAGHEFRLRIGRRAAST
jgi:hypothetical protein